MIHWQRVEQKPYGLLVTEVDEYGTYTQSIQWAGNSITTAEDNVIDMGWKSAEDFIRCRPGFMEVRK